MSYRRYRAIRRQAEHYAARYAAEQERTQRRQITHDQRRLAARLTACEARPGAKDRATQAQLDGVTTALLSAACPECDVAIGAGCSPCRKGPLIGREKDPAILILLNARPIVLAHLARIETAIAAGATTAAAVLAAYPVDPAASREH